MGISFKELEKSVKKLQDIKKSENIVTINDTNITFRCLTQPEEVEATEYVSLLSKKFDDLVFSTSSQAGLGLSLRVGFLSYALIEIDGVDLRNVESIEVEGDEIPKREVITNLLIENWDSDLTQRLWQMWLGFAMEESLKVMNQIQIDTKSIEDQMTFHEQRLENLKARWEAFRGKTLKEKLLVEDAPVQEESPRVVLENPLPKPPQEEISQEPPPPQKWEDIQSSFLGEDDQESIELEEARLRAMALKQNQQPPTLNKGLPNIPVRPPINPNPQVANVAGAFKTGQKVIMREPTETLEETPSEPQQPLTNRGGSLNPNFRKS